MCEVRGGRGVMIGLHAHHHCDVPELLLVIYRVLFA